VGRVILITREGTAKKLKEGERVTFMALPLAHQNYKGKVKKKWDEGQRSHPQGVSKKCKFRTHKRKD